MGSFVSKVEFSRATRWVLMGTIITVQLIVVAWLIHRTAPGLWESRWIQDDAYISFRYARNLVDGNGLVFNPGDRVEGYTNFLWTILSAIPLATGTEDPLPFMHHTGRLFWFGTYGLLLVFGFHLLSRGVLTAPLVALPLIAHWSFNQWFLSGMETGMVSFLFLLTLIIFALQDIKRTRLAAAFGGSCVLLLLSRPDSVFFLIGLAVAGLTCHRSWFVEGEFWRRWLPSFLVPVVLIYAPYTAWRLIFYGDLLPNTYYAKAAYNTAYGRGWDYVTMYFEMYSFAPFLLVPVIAALMTRDPVVRRFLAGSVFGGAAVFFYVIRLGGDFMEWRFVDPITGVLFAGIGVGLYVVGHGSVHWILSRYERSTAPGKGRVVVSTAAAGIACAVIGLSLLYRAAEAGNRPKRPDVIEGQETIESLQKYALGEYAWKEIGRTCKLTFPADTMIATTAAGMIPFFAELPTLDLHGLTDRRIANEPIAPSKPRRMGHEHLLDDRQVMRERGVEVLLPWPDLFAFPRALALPDSPGVVTASIRVNHGRFFDVIFLNPDRDFVRELRQRDGVVFRDLSRVVPSEKMVDFAELETTHRMVDRLDLESESSENAHEFVEVFDPDSPYGHNYHDKVQAYLSEDGFEVLRDTGRRIFHQATWKATGISADRDLIVVVRHDHLATSHYRVEVNGEELPSELEFPRLPERWGEIQLPVPREFLRDGENTFRITRDRLIEGEAEFFHIWFLQENRDAAVSDSPREPGLT
jgi:arabinofuranosyltransferase